MRNLQAGKSHADTERTVRKGGMRILCIRIGHLCRESNIVMKSNIISKIRTV